MKYRVVQITETELEDQVRRFPENIEPGLKYIGHQKGAGAGRRLDSLLVDSGKALVVAELKIVEDDSTLGQGLDYYDEIARNLDGWCSAYKTHGVDSSQEPRLILIAPSFSTTLQNRIKWISAPISLFTYQCIEPEDHKHERIVIYRDVQSPSLPRRVEAYSLQDRYMYITDVQARETAQKFLQQVQSWDAHKVIADPTKWDISIKLSGRVIAYIIPRRKFFYVGTWGNDGKWVVSSEIRSEKELEAVLPGVRVCFDRGGRSAA